MFLNLTFSRVPFLEILLNRRIVLVLLLRIAEIVDLCQVLVQVLGAAGLSRLRERPHARPVLRFVTTWQRAILASASA